DIGSRPVRVEARDVEAELRRIAAEIVVLERLLAVEEELVHLPEASLQPGRLGRGRRGQGVGVLIRQREMTEREADAYVLPALDPLDVPEREARVRAFVVAVLHDRAGPQGPAHVVDLVVKPFHRCAPPPSSGPPWSARGSVATGRAAPCSDRPPPGPSSTAGLRSPAASRRRGSG